MFWALLICGAILAALWLEERQPSLAVLERLMLEPEPVWAPAARWVAEPLVSPPDDALFAGLFQPAPVSGTDLLRDRVRGAFLNEAAQLGLQPQFIPEADEPVILSPQLGAWLDFFTDFDTKRGLPAVSPLNLAAARANYLAKIGSPTNIWG